MEFSLPPLIESLRPALPAGMPVYLVGGAVRDALLGRAIHDLDFIVPANAMQVARRLADQIGAAYYPMDETRDIARVVLNDAAGARWNVDFAVFQGKDLEDDLRKRDFTINAMAVDVRQPQKLEDPTGGLADLLAKRLRVCSPTSIQADPVRILRAVRQAVALDFHIAPESLALIRAGVPLLKSVSVERMRDELFRILGGSQPAVAVRTLEMLGALPQVLPELAALKGVEQSAPHIHEVWGHTLSVMANLQMLLDVLGPTHDPEKAGNLKMGMVVLHLGRYRERLAAHLAEPMTPDRAAKSLLMLAALFHDVGKPATQQADEDGRLRFFNHDEVGARLAARRATRLHLSNGEVERLKLIIRYHLRPLLLVQPEEAPTRRAIYRFFRDCGPAGVDVCILSLADALGTYETSMPQELWARHLGVVRTLLEAWWEKPAESVKPPALLNGHDLMELLGLEPGKEIGRLLEVVREAQATGQIQTRTEALALAKEAAKAA